MKNYSSGIFLFIFISLLTMFFIFLWNEVPLESLIKNLSQLQLHYIGLILFCIIIYLLLEGIRTKILIHALKEPVRLYSGILSGLANELVSAITPFQSGGQPLEMYVLTKRDKIPAGKCGIIAYFRTACNSYCLFIASIITLSNYDKLETISYIKFLYLYGVGFMIYFLGVTMLMIFKPQFIKILSHKIIKILYKFRLLNKKNYYNRLKFTIKEVKNFNYHIKNYYVKHYFYIILSLIMTAAIFFFKYLIGYILLFSMNIYNPLDETIFFQSLIQFVNYAFPSPGASGSTEAFGFHIFKLMNSSLAENHNLSIFTVIWRFFSYHLLIIIAGITCFKWLKNSSKKSIAT